MNYYSLRIILCIILLIVYFAIILILKNKKVIKIETKFLILIYLMLCNFVYFLPYEKFIKYSTIEDSYKYYYPTGSIINKYTYNNNTYVICSTNDDILVLDYKNSNDNWTFSVLEKKYSNELDYIIANFKTEYPDINIIVIMTTQSEREIEYNINDSISSKFDINVTKLPDEYGDNCFVTYTAILKQKISDDYIVSLGENEIIPPK